MTNSKVYFRAILVPVIVGLVIGVITSNSIEYNMLIKPKLAPPSILFPIVWTILYILMGVSYGILDSKLLLEQETKKIYYFQLFVNALWPIFFFTFEWRLFAFIWIWLLIVAVIIMIIKFYKQNKTSGLIQIPYLLWLFFASYLNFSTYLLNK